MHDDPKKKDTRRGDDDEHFFQDLRHMPDTLLDTLLDTADTDMWRSFPQAGPRFLEGR